MVTSDTLFNACVIILIGIIMCVTTGLATWSIAKSHFTNQC
jgi:hypothetical protein